MSVLAALKVVLGLDTGPFQKGATQAQLEAQRMANSMKAAGRAVAAAGAAIVGSAVVQEVRTMARAGLELAGSLAEEAEQLGVSIGALQKYRFIAGQVGIDQEVMDKGLAKLTGKLGDLALKAKGAETPFAKLGLSQAELARLAQMNADQALPFLADKIAALHSPTERAAALADLFGEKMGPKFQTLMSGGAKAIEEITAAYRALGIEITEEQAKKADEALDKMDALQKANAAKVAQISAQHAEQFMLIEQRWAEAKVAFIDVAAAYVETNERLRVVIYDTAEQLRQIPKQMLAAMATAVTFVEQYAMRMARAIKTWLLDNLDNVWERVRTKIVTVRDAFYNLYDAVVGHSYIPDMVDGIAAQMNRLDGVMVAPADKATKKTAEAFKKLADEVQPLLDRLFPEARALNDWRKDLALIDKAEKAKMLDPAQAAEARRRLNQNAVQGSLDAGAGAIGDLVSGAFGKVQESFSGVTEGMEDVRGRLIEANKKIGQSFTDMAQEAVRAIGTLGHAIKDGDFFDILDAVVGLGLQLGGMGVFGSKIAGQINSSKLHYNANGTRYFSGGLSIVGERGPELVNLPRGAQVTPNNKLGWGGGGTTQNYHISGNLLTPEFWAQIQAMDRQAASAGAQGGANMIMRRQARSLGR